MHGQRIGYIRVSSFDQNPERQLEGVAVDRVFTDKASGKDVRRPELENLLAFVREGDTLVVHSMDRLARNLDDLRRLVWKLTERGVRIEFIKEGLTFTGEDSPMANLCSNSPWRSKRKMKPDFHLWFTVISTSLGIFPSLWPNTS